MQRKPQFPDETDLRILRELQADGRLSNKELAARIHLSTTPTFERTRRLEREGYISGYTAIVDSRRLGRGFRVFCNIGFTNINSEKAEAFRRMVEEWPEVEECHNVSGECDYILKVCVADMQSYQRFILEKIGSLPFIERVRSVFIMDTLKQTGSRLP